MILITGSQFIQGYKDPEYEVLEKSEDIDYISDKERVLTKSLMATEIDMVRNIMNYLKLNKFKMKINVTEQTTTFPCPVDKLKGRPYLTTLVWTWLTEHG